MERTMNIQALFALPQAGAQPVLEVGKHLQPRSTPHHLAFTEYHKGGHAAHVILGSQLLMAVYVYLNDVGIIAHPGLKLLEDWALHLARGTPCGIEVDKSGLVAAYNFFEVAHISLRKS